MRVPRDARLRRVTIAAVFHGWTPQTFAGLTWTTINEWYEDALRILEARKKGAVI